MRVTRDHCITVENEGRVQGLLTLARYALRLALDPGLLPGPEHDAEKDSRRRVDATSADELRELAIGLGGDKAARPPGHPQVD